MFSYSTGYYFSPPVDQYLKFKIAAAYCTVHYLSGQKQRRPLHRHEKCNSQQSLSCHATLTCTHCHQQGTTHDKTNQPHAAGRTYKYWPFLLIFPFQKCPSPSGRHRRQPTTWMPGPWPLLPPTASGTCGRWHPHQGPVPVPYSGCRHNCHLSPEVGLDTCK